MIELNDFHNAGFGWICRHCEREFRPNSPTPHQLSRVFREGEAEGKDPALSNYALAKWTDKTRRFLTCPRCGVTEACDNS